MAAWVLVRHWPVSRQKPQPGPGSAGGSAALRVWTSESVFLDSDSSVPEWSVPDLSAAPTPALSSVVSLLHALRRHVMRGAPWGPDEWNLSVGSRSAEHHRRSSSGQKSTTPQSRSPVSVADFSTHAQPCVHTRSGIFAQTLAARKNKEEAGLSGRARSLSGKSSQRTHSRSHANQPSHVHLSRGLSELPPSHAGAENHLGELRGGNKPELRP